MMHTMQDGSGSGVIKIGGREYMDIHTMRLLRISVIALGLLAAADALAQERVLITGQSKPQQDGSGAETEQDAFRNALQKRMRAMSQEEQSLMRDLSVNGRERMARENAASGAPVPEGARYGRGFEARQMQSNTPALGNPAISAPGSNGAQMGAQGGGYGGGRGRGR